MKILILDDDKNRLKTFVQNFIGNDVVTKTTAKETIEELDTNIWDAVFLDHDLGGKVFVPPGPETGPEVAEWLRDHPYKKPAWIIIHSFNGEAASHMLSILPSAIYRPGVWNDIDYLKLFFSGEIYGA
jgi:CheY-like chemotaxis protein